MSPMCETSSKLNRSRAESIAMSIESELRLDARVVNCAPKCPELQQEKRMELESQFIAGLWVQSQSTPSNKSHGILMMLNVFTSEWLLILMLIVAT